MEPRAWSDGTSAARSSITGPILLYAHLTQGDLPLSQVTAMRTVTGPDGNTRKIAFCNEGSS